MEAKATKMKAKEKLFDVVDFIAMGDIIKTKAKVVQDLAHANRTATS